MMEILIRLAATGHSEELKIEDTANADKLISQVAQIYRIHPNDQLMLLKSGQPLLPHHNLHKLIHEINSEKTFVDLSHHNSHDKLPCVYLYNLKELHKLPQRDEKRSNEMLKQQLFLQMQSTTNLKINFYRYASIRDLYPALQLEKHEKTVVKLQSLRQSLKALQKYCEDIKQCYMKTEEVIERCSNQKKSMLTLCKWLKADLHTLQNYRDNLFKLKDDIKNLAVDDKILRQNSGFFQQKKSRIFFYEEKVSEYKVKSESFYKKVKQNMKRWKLMFKEVDEKSVRADTESKIKQCEQRNMANKSSYDEVMSVFSNLIKSGQLKHSAWIESSLTRLEKNSRQSVKEYSDLYQQSIDSYVVFVKYNQRGHHQFRDIFLQCQKYKTQIKELYQEYHQINQEIMIILQEKRNIQDINDIKKDKDPFDQMINRQGNHLMHQKKSSQQQKENMPVHVQQEMKRRVHFNQVLTFVTRYSQQLISQQEKQRQLYSSTYLSESINQAPLQSQLHLNNSKVPSLNIDYQYTSDLLIVKNKANEDNAFEDLSFEQLYEEIKDSQVETVSISQVSIEHFMMLNYGLILEGINKTWKGQQEKKVSNLQDILKKMSEIFVQVYDKKIENLMLEINRVNEYSRDQQSKIESLTQKLAQDSTNTHQNTFITSQLTSCKEEISLLRSQLHNKDTELCIRQRQWRQDRTKLTKLKEDYRHLQSNLIKQTSINQELFSEIQKNLEQIREVTKINDQLQFSIAEQEKQINSPSFNHTDPEVSNNTLQENIHPLKSKVIDDFSARLISSQVPLTNNDDQVYKQAHQISTLQSQIVRLREQIEFSQRDNERLSQEYGDLVVEMDKIIRKQVRDVESQAGLDVEQEKNKQSISIREDIQVGQLAIFIPYNHNTYIAALQTQHDQHKTIPHLLHHSHLYTLDISCFDNKTRDLLTQCSFVVIAEVNKISSDRKGWMVQGKIRHLLGFQQDSPILKNYSSLL